MDAMDVNLQNVRSNESLLVILSFEACALQGG